MKQTTPIRAWAAAIIQQLGLNRYYVKRMGGESKETIRRAYERSKITGRIRYQIMQRDHFQCQVCGRNGRDVPLEVDHRHPVALGGTSHPDNLWTLCLECNRGKGKEVIIL